MDVSNPAGIIGAVIRRLATLVLLFLLHAGCAPETLEWSVAFESSALQGETARLDTQISRGECPGTGLVWSATIHPDDPATPPPDLTEGAYCFSADAGNGGCEWIGRGETSVNLPTDAPLVVTVVAIAPRSNCDGTCQSDGTCDESGGGPMATCPLGGCEQTCDDDCIAACDGGGCRQTCTGVADCTFECAGGGCIVRCEDGADCTSNCLGGECDFVCSDLTTTCAFDCTGGDCGFACTDPESCTTSCGGSCTGP